MSRSAFIAAFAISLTSAVEARADGGDRFELDFAFLAGARSYDDVPFSYVDGAASPALTAPAFRGIPVAGPSFGARAVVNHLRIGFRWERPFARNFDRDFDLQAGAEPTAAGAPATVRALSSSAYRFAIGYEHTIGPVTPFVDLVGTAEVVTADLLAGDTQSTFESAVFGYSLQAGARYHVSNHWFVHLSGELGPTSPIDHSVHLGVGVSIR
jgi:hypothetical protein